MAMWIARVLAVCALLGSPTSATYSRKWCSGGAQRTNVIVTALSGANIPDMDYYDDTSDIYLQVKVDGTTRRTASVNVIIHFIPTANP